MRVLCHAPAAARRSKSFIRLDPSSKASKALARRSPRAASPGSEAPMAVSRAWTARSARREVRAAV